jgi:hypothetical protein
MWHNVQRKLSKFCDGHHVLELLKTIYRELAKGGDAIGYTITEGICGGEGP